MLKRNVVVSKGDSYTQPPSGGCVLKQPSCFGLCANVHQPPSGGCVLKLNTLRKSRVMFTQPPSGGCVLKRKNISIMKQVCLTSRLQAAVC